VLNYQLNRIIHLIAAGLICFAPVQRLLFYEEQNKSLTAFSEERGIYSTVIAGYRDIVNYNGKYLAVGTGGRIDYLNNSGERTSVLSQCKNNLNSVITKDQILVVVGDYGTILFSSDGKAFTKVESGTDININGIANKDELYIAGAEKGTILVSKDGKSWNKIHLEVSGNIVSITANDSFFIGITDSGEIIKSSDGLNWGITDYNKVYSGYNKSCRFDKVLATRNRIGIIGSHDDGSPALLFSSLGNVWTERSLTYNDSHGMIRFLTNKPNDLTYDPVRDQFILACDNGEIFILPSCTKCNESLTISTDDLYCIILTENQLLSIGEGFSVNILKL
jgi:hypothetical protein